MIKYTRAEAVELIDSLIKKLSSKIETLSEVNINDCDNLEISIYLQQNGKEFISLIEKNNIKNELAEYNNQTIAMVLSKILPSAIELELEKGLSKDFCIEEKNYLNDLKYEPLTMQDFTGLLLKNKEQRKQIIDSLDTQLKSHELSIKKLNGDYLNLKQIRADISQKKNEYEAIISKKFKDTGKVHSLSPVTLRVLLDNVYNEKIYSEIEQLEQQLESLESIEKDIDKLDTMEKSGCKIIAMAKMLRNCGYEVSIEDVLENVDSKGNLGNITVNGINIKPEKRIKINSNNINDIVFDKNMFIIARSLLGDKKCINGGGPHFTLVKQIRTVSNQNGNTYIMYDMEPSSKNDIGRKFSSKDAKSIREAKVTELIIYKLENDK